MRYPWLLGMGLLGCIKPSGPVQAPTPLDLRVVPIVASYADATVSAAGPGLGDALVAEVASHALRGALTEAGPALAARDTEARVAALGAGPLVLVEAAPRFSSQMAGRYRWTVDVTLSVVGVGEGETRHFAVPVALVYDHEREQAAADTAAPAIARELREVLDHALAVR